MNSSQASNLSSCASEETKQAPILYKLSQVNQALEALSIEEIPEHKSQDQKYVENKIVEIGANIRSKLKIEEPNLYLGEKVLEQFTSKFDTMSKTDQYRVLTSMPKNSSINTIQQTFGVTEHTAKRAKALQEEQGILSTPNPKPGKRLSPESTDKAVKFYEDDTVSRQMAGKKDCVSVLVDGEKKNIQKRRILTTLKEAHVQFKEKNPDVKIGFSKFAEARPKHVVLPGGSGTHNVCVCVHHQNPKLMIDHSQIKTNPIFKELMGSEEANSYTGEVKYQHLLAQLMCNPPSIACWLGECEECEDSGNLSRSLTEKFKRLDVEQITHKQWESIDRTDLVTHTDTVDDFVEKLVDKLQTLKLHQFIHSQQTAHYYYTKENLGPGEVLVVGDFSENYSFVHQDAVQGVHWSNTSCTLHPWVCYYLGQDGTVKTHTSLMISDCLSHNTVAVYSFQENIIQQLKVKLLEEGAELKKIKYHTDGCAEQYKNLKNFKNLAEHKTDFDVEADWSFSATGHGKGPWDGLAGSAKREAALESLRRSSMNPIQTPYDFFEFVKKKFQKVQVEFISEEKIQSNEKELLSERFKSAKTIKGTRGYHSFETISGNQTELNVRQFSFSEDVKRVSITASRGRGGVRGRGQLGRGQRGRGLQGRVASPRVEEEVSDPQPARGRGRERRRGVSYM